MLRLLAISALFTAITASIPATGSVAVADDDSRAGTEGTVTAYELDGRTVIENKICLRRRHSYDYLGCMSRLRDSVKHEVCFRRRHGGTHHYLYQHGSGRMTRTSVFCPSRR